MSKQIRVYFVDIFEAAEEIEQFTDNLTFEEFTKNKMVIRRSKKVRQGFFSISC